MNAQHKLLTLLPKPMPCQRRGRKNSTQLLAFFCHCRPLLTGFKQILSSLPFHWDGLSPGGHSRHVTYAASSKGKVLATTAFSFPVLSSLATSCIMRPSALTKPRWYLGPSPSVPSANLQVLVTCAPQAFAICTAALPTPPLPP
ncbi:MAG: hypothetical protein FRX49_07611 [Trebouxia sp. A1-2]|nr:MAG: hypothetical protein FRX49_13027 [Trebouxia sp. A1-2]KAA6422436.1 MAG: hypothetical protein FRX49_07611 [Trebouxia sp. A1-2]